MPAVSSLGGERVVRYVATTNRCVVIRQVKLLGHDRLQMPHGAFFAEAVHHPFAVGVTFRRGQAEINQIPEVAGQQEASK